MLTGQSMQTCLRRELPTDHEARSHEQLRRVATTELRRESTLEAEVEHAKHDRIRTQAPSEESEQPSSGVNDLHAERAGEGGGACQTSRPRAARERPKQLLETAQDLVETEASHCTGGVRRALAE